MRRIFRGLLCACALLAASALIGGRLWQAVFYGASAYAFTCLGDFEERRTRRTG